MDITSECLAAQNDLKLLIDHAVRRPPPTTVDNKKLEDGLEALNLPVSSLASKANIVLIFSSLDYFSRYLYPATLEGLRCASVLPTSRYDLWKQVGLLIFLIFTVLLQCYAIFGTAAISKIDNNAAIILGIQKQVQAMQAASPGVEDKFKKIRNRANGTDNNTSDPDNYSITSYALKRDELRGAEEAQCYAFRSVYQFNAIWGKIPTLGNSRGAEPFCPSGKETNSGSGTGKETNSSSGNCQDNPLSPKCQILYGTEFDTRFVIKILDTIVLPILYSTMGAWVWIIRDRSIKRENKSLERYDMRFRISRIALAAALGSVLGFFYSSITSGSVLSSVPLAGIGFLVGYNSELMFRWFDDIIAGVGKRQ